MTSSGSDDDDTNSLSSSDDSAEFMIDFAGGRIFAWGTDCTHTAMGDYGEDTCDTAPTNMDMYFDGEGSNLYSGYGSYSDLNIGGYTVSGTRYFANFCISSGNACTTQRIYSGDTISANDWLYN